MYKPGVQSYSKLILGRLVLLTLFRCHQIYRIMIAVSDLERAIAGLAQFEQKCPPQIRCLGHFGALSLFVDARNF